LGEIARKLSENLLKFYWLKVLEVSVHCLLAPYFWACGEATPQKIKSAQQNKAVHWEQKREERVEGGVPLSSKTKRPKDLSLVSTS
jgi:hypothetical protein